MLGGRLLTGHSGLAGEIGHVTAVPEGGRKCGCGNTGCLETVASDSALAFHASRKLGRAVTVDEVIELARSGTVDLAAELDAMAGYLAVGVAAVINLFNPAVVFVHCRCSRWTRRCSIASSSGPVGARCRPRSPTAASSARKEASVRARWRVSFST